MRYFISILLFIFPTILVEWFINLIGAKRYHIGRNVKIGFSFIRADKIDISDNARIGHFNFILVRDLKMAPQAYINHLNMIKGNFDLIMGVRATINKQNKVANSLTEDRRQFKMDFNTLVGVSHVLDVTDSIWMKDNSRLAGCGSQIWTHSFKLDPVSDQKEKKKGPVVIGKNVYIGARAVICLGVEIADTCTIGAGCVVSKSLTEAALYVNQPLRMIKR